MVFTIMKLQVVGLLFITSTTALQFKDVQQLKTKQRCPHWFADIANIIDGYRLHKSDCQRRYEGLPSDSDD